MIKKYQIKVLFFFTLNYMKFKIKFDISILHVAPNIVLLEYLGLELVIRFAFKFDLRKSYFRRH